MKAFVFLLLSVFCLSSDSRAVETAPVPTATERLPGVDFAEGISQITGTAISPMLGVSAAGAWRYYRTPGHLRGRLPWFCHPVAWGLGFTILGMCFLKDAFGAGAPPLVKKPLDMAELFEDKLSALVASAAFVPFIVAQMSQHFSETPLEPQASISGGTQLASALPIFGMIDIQWLLLPFSIVSFILVWMSAHTINVLIALSPFGILDAGLKLLKTAVLSSVVVTSFVYPLLGAVVSLFILCLAAYFAPKAFRFTLFGTMLALDVLLPWRARRLATPEQAHGFIARRSTGLPVRTFGRVVCGSDGALHFSYRPWMILPRRTVRLPEGTFALAKGLLYPSLLHGAEGSPARSIILFLPRYRSHEESIAGFLAIVDVRENTLTRGLKAARSWFAETMQPGQTQPGLPVERTA